jgi:MinD-like ATPase involved in chromosome partitioning or flagellar assembly
MRKMVGASAAGDVRNVSELTAQLGRPVPSCRRIVVTSIRGGAGKSSVAALVADVLRRHRDDRVLAIDADPGMGSLPLRLGVTPRRSLRELAAARPRSWEEAAAFLAHTEDGLWVLSGASDGVSEELSLKTFQVGAGTLGRYFAAAVIDCGAGLVSGLHREVLGSAHAQVFVVPGTGDGALSARAALDWFGQNGLGALLSRTVIALVGQNGGGELDRAAEALADGGASVVSVPYDRHLASGSAIVADRIAAATRTAATRIAAEAFAHTLTWGPS